MQKTYLERMVFGIKDKKHIKSMMDYIKWRKRITYECTLTVGDVFKHLNLFLGELPFEFEVKYFYESYYEVFPYSLTGTRDLWLYYAVIIPKNRSIKDDVFLKITFGALNSSTKETRDYMIKEFIELWKNNYLVKPNIKIPGARFINENSEVKL